MKLGEKYYAIELYKGEIIIRQSKWNDDPYFDEPALKLGNFFPWTREGKRRANEVVKQIKTIFKNAKCEQSSN